MSMKDNIKMGLNEVCRKVVYWTCMVQDRDHRQTLMNSEELPVP
jgi:hypothetical protein